MTTTTAEPGRRRAPARSAAAEPAAAGGRDRYVDALRAGALVVVVLGHWAATLPRTDAGLRGTDHLLAVWPTAGVLTWALQVVPLFVFVSAAVSARSAARCTDPPGLAAWWGARALRLARPTATYLWALAALAALATLSTGTAAFVAVFDTSLTIHLWFLLLLLCLQALLPLAVRADRRWGLAAVAVLVAGAAGVDVLRALGAAGPLDPGALGAQVTAAGGGVGWLSWLLVWLVPQQLGVAWAAGRLRGGALLAPLGLGWLLAAVRLGYPAAMVGGDLAGGGNLLPPTIALLGVVWLQVGLVVALEPALRPALSGRGGRAVAVLTALGMPLYLWHKLAEVPAAAAAVALDLPVDAGVPGDPGFWTARLSWLALTSAAVVPVLLAVLAVEGRRRPRVAVAAQPWRVVLGGAGLLTGLGLALAAGATGGALPAALLVTTATLLLRSGRPAGASGRLTAEVLAVDQVDAATRDAAWALFAAAYAGADRRRFAADLAGKDRVILLREPRSGALAGFSTLRLDRVDLRPLGGRGAATVVFSGDTVLDPAHWGGKVLQRTFAGLLLRERLRHPIRPLRWLLVSKGWKTYLMLVRAFPGALPRRGRADDPAERRLLDAVAAQRFGAAYEPATGLVRHRPAREAVRPGLCPVDAELRAEPDVAYFLARNPGHAAGDELACLAPVRTRDLLRRIARSVLERGSRR